MPSATRSASRSQSARRRTRKYLGKGTYGCYVVPALRCLGGPERPPAPENNASEEQRNAYRVQLKAYRTSFKGLASKIVKKSVAETEMATSEIVRTIDPENKYSLYPIHICQVDPDDLKDSRSGGKKDYTKGVKECLETPAPGLLSRYKRKEEEAEKAKAAAAASRRRANQDAYEAAKKAAAQAKQAMDKSKLAFLDGTDPEDAWLVMAKYGGTDVENIKVDRRDVGQLFESFLNLFEGVVKFHEKNFIHMDIKPGNVVVVRGAGGALKSYMVDFGLSLTLERLFSKTFLTNYPDLTTANYFLWPQELKVAYPLYVVKTTRDAEKTRDAIKGELRDVPAQREHIDSLFKDMWLSKPVRTWIDGPMAGVRGRALSNYAFKPADPTWTITEKIFKGVDVYSLGLLIKWVYTQHVGQRSKAGAIPYEVYNETASEWQQKRFGPSDALYESCTKPFEAFVKKLTSFSYKTRPTAEEAFEGYKELLPKLKRFFDSADYEEYLKERGSLGEAAELEPLIMSPFEVEPVESVRRSRSRSGSKRRSGSKSRSKSRSRSGSK